jgi:Mg2+/Co2+ transporter CorB
MIDCRFTAHFFFMKCECVVSGLYARIELSIYLLGGLIGSSIAMTMMAVTVTMVMMGVVGVAGVVGKAVVGVVVAVVAVVVVEAMATINVQAIMKPAADDTFVPVVRSLIPVYLERCSFRRTHSQILSPSKH